MVRSRLVPLLIVPLFFVVAWLVLSGVHVRAMTFAAFDKMDAFNQGEFVAVMVDVAETSLRKAGKADLSARLEQAFGNTTSGVSPSEGVAQLEMDIKRARASGVPVQQAMLWTMEH